MTKKYNVVHQWAPAHAGINRNDEADILAKEDGFKPQLNHTVSYMEAKTLLKSSFIADYSLYKK